MRMNRITSLLWLSFTFHVINSTLDEGRVNPSNVPSSDLSKFPEIQSRIFKRFCPKYDHMVHSGVTTSELEKAIDNELKSEIFDFVHKRNIDSDGLRNRGRQNIGPNGYVALITDDEVGPYGQLLRSEFIGTGQSTGSYPQSIITNQMNQKISDSDVNEIYATFEPVVSMSRAKSGKSEPKSSNILQRKAQKSISPCENTIKSLYNRLIRSSNGEKVLPRFSQASRESQNSLDQSMRGFNMNDGENSTLVDTQIKIGPGGYSGNVINMATGEANNTGGGVIFDAQGHGMFKGSAIKFTKLSFQVPIQTKRQP